MAYLKIKNRAVSSLASDVTDVATSWVLATGEGTKFPATGDFHLTCENEIVKCTARTTDTLTVVRAQEGTTGVAHVAGKGVELRITAGVFDSRDTWTLDKLKKGAGAGSDPTEISGWEKVAEAIISGAAVDYVDFTGLDINTDKTYIAIVTIYNPAASHDLCFCVEGDYTPTNYYSQYIEASDITVAAARQNHIPIAYCPTGVCNLGFITITRDPLGYARAVSVVQAGAAAGVIINNRAVCKIATVANITSIRFLAGVVGGIGIGSRLSLFKPGI